MKSSLHSKEDYNMFKSATNDEDDEVESPPTPPPKPRGKTLRGAALRLATANKPENNVTDEAGKESLNSLSNLNVKEGGVYASKLNSTKQAGREIINRIINEEHLNAKKKSEIENKENHKKKNVLSSGSDSSSSSDIDTLSDNDSSDNSAARIKRERKRKQNATKQACKADREASPSPPSSPDALTLPMSFKTSKLKRKTSTAVNKKLNELGQFLNKNKNVESNVNDSANMADDDDGDIQNSMTVRVSTRFGTKKFEINDDQTFQPILDALAVLEKTCAQNLVLVLNDQALKFYDTPLSVNLKITDILNVKTTRVAQERIKVCSEENNEDEDNNDKGGDDGDGDARLVKIILQTNEGRKSRVKLQVVRDEPFRNILKKYCEIKSLDWTSGTYILEFDGDKVGADETANDLDLDGDECFDVKQSTKSSMQFIQGNKKNYDYDEDVLTM
jgi:hypothetical protein